MRCSHCNYETTARLIFCPACGERINESCKLAVINGRQILTRILLPACPYVQQLVMVIDEVGRSQPVQLNAGFPGGLQTFCFDYDRNWEPGIHMVRIDDMLRPYQAILEETPVPFMELALPVVALDKYVFINDGRLQISISNVQPELKGLINLYYSINHQAQKCIGTVDDGNLDILITDWHKIGVSFDNSDCYEARLELSYGLWDTAQITPFYSNNIFFVNRYRLREISYVAPGLEPSRVAVDDQFGAEAGIGNADPIELFSYPNPYQDRNWQKDKRYFKIRESFNDLLDIANQSGREPELFMADLEYDRQLMDLSIKRIEKFRTGDLILQINAANEGRHRIELVLSIGDVSCPGGRYVVRIPIWLNVITANTPALGLGLDFGTSRTMASVFNDNDTLHEVVGLDLDLYGPAFENKMASSVIPEDKTVYKDQELGLIYPYICSRIQPHGSKDKNYGLKLYIKRDIPKIMRNNREITNPLREAIESMFETLIGRVAEYILQTMRRIPRISDVCLGCPTIFDDSTIMQYAGYLKNVCLASPIQLSPYLNVTVWDEVWAAFYHINSEYNLETGYYLIWDMGGGTTDVVLVDLRGDSSGAIPVIGFNSDCLGGKDVNEELRRLVAQADPKDAANLGESDIESLKLTLASTPEGSFRGLPHRELSNGLLSFIEQRVGQVAAGLVDSMRRLGGNPERITLLPVGGSAHLNLLGSRDELISLGDIILHELQNLLPGIELVIHSMHNAGEAQELNRKACTSLGLSALTCNEAYKGKINRLPGLEEKCRYTIVRRNMAGTSEIVMRMGDPLDKEKMQWLDSTVMFLVFGGSSTDDNINIPVVYGNKDGWEGFLANVFNPLHPATEA